MTKEKLYFIGNSENNSFRLDVYYTEPFIRPERIINQIRISDKDDIVAMKIDIISRGGRKKDFWDLHELFSEYSIKQMINLHKERFPYSHSGEEIISGLRNFDIADSEFDPVCLLGKHWEVIKLDFMDALEGV